MTLEDQDLDDAKPTFFEHTRKPEWGLAVLAWERDGKRGYQFEDGELRVIKDGYYKLLAPVDPPADRAAKTLAQLRGRVELAPDSSGSRPQAPAVSLAQQIQYFQQEFPNGFNDEAWLKKHRGKDAPRRLKRHRNAAIESARELLSKESLDQFIAAEDFDAVRKHVVEVWRGTDFATKREVDKIAGVAAARLPAVAKALRELLYGEGEFEKRFDRWLTVLTSALGKRPSWRVASSIPALIYPEQHLCVRSSAFRLQAAWMAPKLSAVSRVTGALYTRWIAMAHGVREELASSGSGPNDMLDIHDFVIETLRSKAIEKMESMPKLRPTAPLSSASVASTPAPEPAAAEPAAAESSDSTAE